MDARTRDMKKEPSRKCCRGREVMGKNERRGRILVWRTRKQQFVKGTTGDHKTG